jgi:hypothetical protein
VAEDQTQAPGAADPNAATTENPASGVGQVDPSTTVANAAAEPATAEAGEAIVDQVAEADDAEDDALPDEPAPEDLRHMIVQRLKQNAPAHYSRMIGQGTIGAVGGPTHFDEWVASFVPKVKAQAELIHSLQDLSGQELWTAAVEAATAGIDDRTAALAR